MKRLLFIGTYTARGSRGLYACHADSQTGALTPLSHPLLDEPVRNPTFLACRGEWLYAVSEIGDPAAPRPGAITALRFLNRHGALTQTGSLPCGRGAPCHVLIFDEGRRLAVSQYKTGELYIVSLAPDGALNKVETIFRSEGHGPMTDRQEGPHFHSACASPDGKSLFAADLGTDRVFRYRITPEALIPQDPLACPPGSGPRHMAISPDGRFLWVVGELDSSITLFVLGPQGARLAGQWPLLPAGFHGESWAAEIRRHPDTGRLYVSNRGLDDVVVLDVSAAGTPRVAGRVPAPKWPRGMILSPDGRFLYVAGQHDDRIAIYALEPATGLPRSCGALTGIPSPVGFAFAD